MSGPCDAVACGPGSYSYTFPGACCPTCVHVQQSVSGMPARHASPTVPNQCCGMCVADPQSCESGRMSYEVFRSQLLDKYGSPGCKTDDNCVIASEINRCVSRCGVALPGVTAGDWKSNSLSFGETNCSNCPLGTAALSPLPKRDASWANVRSVRSALPSNVPRNEEADQKYTERVPSTVRGGAAVECVASDAGCCPGGNSNWTRRLADRRRTIRQARCKRRLRSQSSHSAARCSR